jgi:hypothetical protein
MTARQQVFKTIEELPEEARVEDAIERLYLLYKIETGIEQADRDKLVSHEEARHQMARWLE